MKAPNVASVGLGDVRDATLPEHATADAASVASSAAHAATLLEWDTSAVALAGRADEHPYHALTVDQALCHAQVGASEGLSSADAARRRKHYGPNELLLDKPPSFGILVVRHVVDFLFILLLVAAGLCFGLAEYVDGAVILAIEVVNVVVGCVQEHRAEQTLDALRNLVAPSAVVLRDGGTRMQVAATELVPGDVIELSVAGAASSAVPADARVISCVDLETVEATLTGESKPVRKSNEAIEGDVAGQPFHVNHVFAGTAVSAGYGLAVVLRTGMATELGKIAKQVSKQSHQRTELQRELRVLSYVLSGVGVLFAIIVFAAKGFHVGNVDTLRYTAVYAVAVIVAIIPEEMALLLTLTLVLGVRRMAALNVIVRRMSSLEELGRVTDICTDKTGTITQAALSVTRLWTGGESLEVDETVAVVLGPMQPLSAVPLEDEDAEEVRMEEVVAMTDRQLVEVSKGHPALRVLADVAGRCNDAVVREENGTWHGVGHATDVALRLLAVKLGYVERFSAIQELPFDSSLKRVVTVVRDKDGALSVLAKGSLDSMLHLCTRMEGSTEARWETDRDAALLQMHSMAQSGLHVVAMAARGAVCGDNNLRLPGAPLWPRDVLEHELVLIGLVGMHDPARVGVAEAVQDCLRGGIRVRMLTGDDARTATAVAMQVGIIRGAESALHAREFDARSDEQLDAQDDLPRVVARCTPESKVKMVNALHRRRCIVAMTGDGVNDAPALSAANVGLAMGKSGSDVARQAADLVLSDDNFVSLVGAVREGRRIFYTMKKLMVQMLSANVGMTLVLMAGLAVRDPSNALVFPLSPLEVLVLNVIVLPLPLVGLVLEPPAHDVMRDPPRRSRHAVTRRVLLDIAVYGTLMGSCATAVFVAILYGVDHGVIGVNCYGVIDSSNAGRCDTVLRARAALFLTLALIITFSCFNCRHAHRPVWHDLRNVTLFMWIASAAVLALVAIILFVPHLNSYVFHHAMPTWEIAIAFGGLAAFVIVSIIYKMTVRHKMFRSPASGKAYRIIQRPQ